MHVTPASSACPQFVTPHLEKVHRKMVSSVPLQATSSIQILPVPVETIQHGFLAGMQESRTERNESIAVSVLDQVVLGCAGNSSGSHLPSSLHQDKILIFWAKSLEGRITVIDSDDGNIYWVFPMIFLHSHRGVVRQVIINPFHIWGNWGSGSN